MIPKMSAPKRGRKPLQDKKQMIRLFVPESRIKALGGIQKTQDKLYKIILSVNSKP